MVEDLLVNRPFAEVLATELLHLLAILVDQIARLDFDALGAHLDLERLDHLVDGAEEARLAP